MCELFRIKVIAFIILYVGITQLCFSQSDNREDIDQIKRDVLTIRNELADIKSLLKNAARSQNTQLKPQLIDIKGMEIDISSNPIKGSVISKLALIEFTDYQCQYCSEFVRETFPKISEQYIDKGLIRYMVMDKPLSMHKMADSAAEASHCANDQGKYWEMHNMIMSKPEMIDNLLSYAISLNLDINKYEECLKTKKYSEFIAKELSIASKLGIQGVPGFIIASIDPNNPTKAQAISVIRGAIPYIEFQKEINKALASVLFITPNIRSSSMEGKDLLR
jgi:protein-disulfide isomerase